MTGVGTFLAKKKRYQGANEIFELLLRLVVLLFGPFKHRLKVHRIANDCMVQRLEYTMSIHSGLTVIVVQYLRLGYRSSVLFIHNEQVWKDC